MAAPQSHINTPAVDIGTLYNQAASPTSPIGQLYNSFGPAGGTAKAQREGAGGEKISNSGGYQKTAGPTAQTINNPFWTQYSNNFAKNWQNDPRSQYFQANYKPPFPNAPHDGGPQDLANQAALTKATQGANSYAYAVNNKPTWLDQLALTMGVGTVTAGFGAAFAPAIAGTAAAGDAAATSGALGAGFGSGGALTAAGSATVGAATGAVGGLASSGLSGGNVLKKIGTGALMGGVTAGLGSALSSDGLSPLANNAISKVGTGALGGAISGRGAGAGAVGGALSAAGGAAGGAIGGSIFNSGNTIPTSNSTDIPSNTNMSVDPSYFNDPTFSPGGSAWNYSDTTGTGQGPLLDTSGNSGLDYITPSNTNYMTMPSGGAGGGSGAGAQAGGSILSGLAGKLSSLFGGNISPGQMQSLLGTLASGGAEYLNSNAAKGAANTFAGQTKFSPYGVNTGLGSTSFNGTNATQTLSPQEQAIQKMLGGVAGSSGAALAAGPGATQTADFNALQSGDLQAQQRLLGNTQDNEFSRGILGSTAGGYQTQAALNAIGNQTNQNQVTAQNMAQNQQQQQLAQLTGSLNGMSGINNQQLQQILAGFGGGSAASNANDAAYSPSLAANSNTPIGKLLGTIGNQASTTPFVNPTTGP